MKLGIEVWAGNKALGYVNLNLIFKAIVIDSIQLLSCVQLFLTPQTAARQASLSITISQSLLKLMSIELMMHSNHLILCHPLLLLSIFPSIRFFFNESVLYIGQPKYWSFTFNISLSNEYLGLISFRIDWFDLLAFQGTLNRHPTPKFKTINSSHSAFFTVQLSHPYMTTWKTIDQLMCFKILYIMHLLYTRLCA